MWCANGFATFLEIQKELRLIVKSDAGFNKVHETMRGEDTWLSALLNDGVSNVMTFEDARKSTFAECVNEFFSNCMSLSVISPSGTCLRIDGRIGAYRLIPSLGWQYLFIDTKTGTISGEQLSRCVSAASQTLAKMRDEIEEIDRDELAYLAYVKLCAVEDDQDIWNTFKVFEGWAIGCELDDSFLIAEDFIALDLISSDIPKDRMTPNLKDAIVEAFDGGVIRNKHSLWKESFPDESRVAFRAAWAEAALERPELSKRGPKPLT